MSVFLLIARLLVRFFVVRIFVVSAVAVVITRSITFAQIEPFIKIFGSEANFALLHPLSERDRYSTGWSDCFLYPGYRIEIRHWEVGIAIQLPVSSLVDISIPDSY